MNKLKGMSWYQMNEKIILMITDACKNIPIIMPNCCDIIICSPKIAKQCKEKFSNSGAKIISF